MRQQGIVVAGVKVECLCAPCGAAATQPIVVILQEKPQIQIFRNPWGLQSTSMVQV